MSVIMEGIVFGECPRWHEGRIWFSDWGAGQVISLDARSDGGSDGGVEPTVEARVRSFPMCIDFLPDGRLLVVSAADRVLLVREADGTLNTYADLDAAGNDIVVDSRGHAYVNCVNFDFPGGEFRPGFVLLVRPDGEVVRVAEGLAFPNGMAVSAEGGTLLVAESYAEQVTAYDIADDGTLAGRRVWAPTPGDHPDGICLDVEGALWYADVGNRRCVRVREGGEILDVVELDRGAFACVLNRGPSPVLYVVGQNWNGPASVTAGGTTGQLFAFPAPAAGAGHP